MSDVLVGGASAGTGDRKLEQEEQAQRSVLPNGVFVVVFVVGNAGFDDFDVAVDAAVDGVVVSADGVTRERRCCDDHHCRRTHWRVARSVLSVRCSAIRVWR